ncbi:zinc-dependent metalloprotease [Solimonas marina]|uniref:DUF5117 domain-containing protein n=1 Tax=Solimonas marina TaxID=2714601 RepID=A0A969WCF1_9GAMM|nr:zinc-dependent metalloprotease [Solimonas marina]NKF22861.1 DUF5117 domain-containing protein [Solimonas marina]
MTHPVVRRQVSLLGAAVLGLALLASPAAQAATPSIDKFTSGMQHQDGFLPLYWDADSGHIYMEVPKAGTEALFFTTIAQGIGSNDIGVDRGQISRTKLVRFDRIGDKLMLTALNEAFRADTDDEGVKLGVEQSFADSTLFGFKIAAQSGDHLLIDATNFVLQDGHGVIERLKRSHQGDFKVDPSRSAIAMDGTKAFEKNSELTGTLTLAANNPGNFVRDVAEGPSALTIKERYSFFELPPPGFKPRVDLPGDGYTGWDYVDYGAPLGEPMVKHYIARHRLEKKDPTAAISDPVKPIVYYIDSAAPAVIRAALLRGASWWNQAFTAAGYRNAFQVKVLPKGADALDGRYNIIQWVSRLTRGWSYGYGVIDPRDGEIIKGNVTLGALRVRYDYMMAEGLLSPYTDPDHPSTEAEKMALARLSQLAAHELGHTLGLTHNHMGSTEGRSSVMDYPAPLVKLDDNGNVDLSDAYAVGIGDWDKVTIDYGYQDFPQGTDEKAALTKILADARDHGLHFLGDQDSRADSTASPPSNQWVNGTDNVAELKHAMKVRAAGLKKFGEDAIRGGQPMATIEEALVPLYLYHRYQAKAAATMLGGQIYTYAVRGDGQLPTKPVPADQQRAALAALIDTLAPSQLTLSPKLLSELPPRPQGYRWNRELFTRTTGITFDPLAPAAAASQLTIGLLLNPDRVARLSTQHAVDDKQLSLLDVMDAIDKAAFDGKADGSYEDAIREQQQTIFVTQLLKLATESSSSQVRADAEYKLGQIEDRLSSAKKGDAAQRAGLLSMLKRYDDGTLDVSKLPEPTIPPGAPI